MEVKDLVTKLSKYYWSPLHPSNYTIKNLNNSKPCGIGLIAHTDYAAFNLAWTVCEGKWNTMAYQLRLVTEFERFKLTTPTLVAGFPLSEWFCLFKPTEALHWLNREGDVSDLLRKTLTPILEKAVERYEV